MEILFSYTFIYWSKSLKCDEKDQTFKRNVHFEEVEAFYLI